MTKIPLPPLPEPVNFSDVQIEGDTEFNEQYKVPGYTANQLRARDLEVARVVLTSVRQAVLALAQKQQTIGRQFAVIDCEETIRALEFTHG